MAEKCEEVKEEKEWERMRQALEEVVVDRVEVERVQGEEGER